MIIITGVGECVCVWVSGYVRGGGRVALGIAGLGHVGLRVQVIYHVFTVP